PMRFACVACDATAHKMVVYSNETRDIRRRPPSLEGPPDEVTPDTVEGTPEMEVAEAVRRSMAIPLIFEPRREGTHEIVDGGTMDNFPVGFYLAKENGYVNNTAEDMQRKKVGFSPKGLGLGPPEQVEDYLPGGAVIPLGLAEVRLLNRIWNLAITNMSDSPLLEAMLRQLRDNTPTFYPVDIDFKGNGALDFFVTKAKFKRMCSKGWSATVETMQKAISSGKPLVPGPLNSANPYS